jgi:acyl-CoA carboxylase epsilon subunit
VEKPFLQVVRGDATPEEIAALVTVLAASATAAATRAAETTRPATAWADRRRQLRNPLPHGPGAWRASALPHG